MAKHFTFRLKDEYVRGMTRQQYKQVTHYARWLAWFVDQRIDWEKFTNHLTDVVLYGRSLICFEDMYNYD